VGKARVGYEVPQWTNKPFHEFTNEELLEYWYKLRLTTKPGEVSGASDSTSLYVASLQQEIESRMKGGL
jgi:hypothetical protein